MYGELYEGMKFEREYSKYAPTVHPLFLIASSDGSDDSKGKLRPLYVTAAGLPAHIRKLPGAKMLVGYLPMLSAAEQDSKVPKYLKKIFFTLTLLKNYYVSATE